MQHTGHQEHQDSVQRSFWSRGNIVLVAFLAIAGFYLIAEHRGHVFGYLPFLLLLACPLLHLFMHRGHGGGGSGEHGRSATARSTDKQSQNQPPPVGDHRH